MPTNQDILEMADKLDRRAEGLHLPPSIHPTKNILIMEAMNEAAAMLRALATERDQEFICGRCGQRFDGPKEEIDF